MKRTDLGGFTLLELLVAVSVVTVLVLACGAIMKIGADDQQQVSSDMALDRQVNRLIEQLTADLTVAHSRAWHEGRHPGSCMAGWYALKPMKAQSKVGGVGDLCAIGYALRDLRLDPRSQVLTRCVVRIQRDSQEVFEAIETNEEEELWKLDGKEELLATGVLGFELWPLLQDGVDDWQPWHPKLRLMPEAVELRLLVASTDLQKRLKSSESWERARLNLEQLSGADYRELRTFIHLGSDAD